MPLVLLWSLLRGVRVIINTDGNTKGENPGVGAVGMVIRDEDEAIIWQGGEVVGWGTNNEVEYKGMILALGKALDLGATEATVRMDSELVVRQMRGEYRVKMPNLKPLYDIAAEEVERFEKVSFVHIPRKQNELADQLARDAWDEDE